MFRVLKAVRFENFFVLFCFVDGKVDAVVFGTGTGGTLAGVGTYVKEKNNKVQVFLADPQVKYSHSYQKVELIKAVKAQCGYKH